MIKFAKLKKTQYLCSVINNVIFFILLIKLREATSVIEQEESNVCPSISYYVASDTKEVLQVFYSVDQISFVVKVNNVAYNFKYDDAKSIKDFIENLK